MAIIVSEKFKGRRSDDAGSAEVVYLVQGTDSDAGNVEDDDAIAAVAGVAPETWNGIPAENIDARNELIQGTWWEVAVTYSVTSPTIFNTGSVQYEFGFTAPVARIYYSLETRSITGAAASYPTTTFGGKIRGQNGDEEGIDLPSPAPTNSWIFNMPIETVTDAYQQGVEAIMGSVNSTTFKGRAANTMRLVGCFGGARNNKDWQIRFDFQFSANRTNVNVGGIVVPSIHGHNLIWDYTEDSEDATLGGTTRKPKAIIVERVFPTVNFSVLGF
jgi:hypothetical protein